MANEIMIKDLAKNFDDVQAVNGLNLEIRKGELFGLLGPMEQIAIGKTARLFFVDHWRAFLTILVVLHHIALVYGASLQGYYFVEPPFTSPKDFTQLLAFALVNQGWFMGAFFLIAGYFTPGSFDRKGAVSFIKDKLIRLGIPLLVFYFVLSPIAFIGYFLMPAELTGMTTPLTWASFWNAYPNFAGLGPVWFLAMLLVFDFGYVILRMLTGKETSDPLEECQSSQDWHSFRRKQ